MNTSDIQGKDILYGFGEGKKINVSLLSYQWKETLCKVKKSVAEKIYLTVKV